MWAASQAAPMRRVVVNGLVSLMDYCDGSPDYASGGFIADSQFNGSTIINGSQQQYITRNTTLDGWTNGVWNQVFCGDPGAPAQSFATDSGHGGPNPYTTLAACPVTKEAPYLYLDSTGKYRVFVPSAQKNTNGPTWANGATPGKSLSLDSFYVVDASSTIDQINLALAPVTTCCSRRVSTSTRGDPRAVAEHADHRPGLPDAGPDQGQRHAGHPGRRRPGPVRPDLRRRTHQLPGAGPARQRRAAVNHADNPDTVSDVFFRVGGATAGTVKTAFVDNSSDSILDDVWVWRADHGAGAGVWSGDQSDTGLIVNGNRVTAYGLAVEHFQKTETVWNGQGGTVLFFQNENPYEVPSQDVWKASATQNGYPAFTVGPKVTSFQGYGMGSYSFFNQGVDIENSEAFSAPSAPGVQFHDILTVFLTGSGGIQSVINGTGQAVNMAYGGPSNLVSYP